MASRKKPTNSPHHELDKSREANLIRDVVEPVAEMVREFGRTEFEELFARKREDERKSAKGNERPASSPAPSEPLPAGASAPVVAHLTKDAA